MRIIHFELAKTGNGISGGESCMVQTIKYLAANKISNVIVTNQKGLKVYSSLGVKEGKYIEYKIVKSINNDDNSLLIFFSYILATFRSAKLLKKFKLQKDDRLICHSYFFPNSISTYLLARRYSKPKVFYWYHAVAPPILKGYKGEFTNAYNIPTLTTIHNSFNQYLYRLLTLKSGVIININPFYTQYLKKRFPKNKLFTLKYFSIVNASAKIVSKKKYDICWIGRFQELKGLDDFIKILTIVKRKYPKLKVVLIGGGNENSTNKFQKNIKAKRLNRTVNYKGFIITNKRFNFLSRSKVFAMTSIHESFGIVNIEAMKLGIPVVAFDLPTFKIFKRGIVKVPILDHEKFADQLLRLIKNEKYRINVAKEARIFANYFQPKKTQEQLLKIITQIS